MAPTSVSNWRRPYTSIYNDNYRYGSSLYSDTLSDIEKRYSDSLSKTQLRSDRRDLGFSTFADSTLASSPNPGAAAETSTPSRPISLPTSPVREPFKGSTFESRLNSAFHSPYAENDAEAATTDRKSVRATLESPRPKSLYDDAVFWTLPKLPEKAELDLDSSRSRRTKDAPSNGPTSGLWREKSRDLQNQLDTIEKSLSDSSNRLKNELSTIKNKCHSQMSDLNTSVEQTSQQVGDLQKTVKKQANQLLELQSAYDDTQRNLQDALDEASTWQGRCKSLKKEMDRLREEVEQAMQKSSSKA